MAVAFSGGADSSLLLQAAVEAQGKEVLAILAVSCLQPEEEICYAKEVVKDLGCHFVACEFFPLDWPEFVANPANRCYDCKKRLYSTFLETMQAFGCGCLLDGTNADDLHQERAGRAERCSGGFR